MADTNMVKAQENGVCSPVKSHPLTAGGDERSDEPVQQDTAKISDHLTEEEENELLADEDDMDVIDLNTDIDLENDFCMKEEKGNKQKSVKNIPDDKNDDSGDLKVTHAEGEKSLAKFTPDSGDVDLLKKGTDEQQTTPEKIAPDLDEEDEDVIQLYDDVSDTFLEAASSTSVTHTKPEISLRVKNESEKDRILSEPLVKQMVIPEICVSDDEDDKISIGSQESLSLQIDHFVEKSAEALHAAKEVGATKTAERPGADEAGQSIKNVSQLNSSAGSESGLHGANEDPDVLKLKLDLYQEMGSMEYEEHERVEEVGKLTGVRIKAEPHSPARFYQEDIPTIELTSTDEEAELVVRQEPPSPVKKSKRSKKRRSKKKTSTESIELKMVSSEDSFPIVVESTVSIDSHRIRNDSEGSFDDAADDGRKKALRNRMVTISAEVTNEKSPNVKKSKQRRKSVDSTEPPVKRKKKVDPAMIGYHKRRKSVARSISKSSVFSISTATSSIPEEDMIVLSAEDVLCPDADAIEGIKNIENQQEDSTKEDEKSASESKEELMHSLDLKEAIAKELEQEVPSSKDNNESDESHLVPTTDIALEDMLESFIEKETNEKNAELVFHSISPEEKFLMDSLFADCEKQSEQGLSSHEHLESLNTIMDDGKPLVEPLNGTEPISISYTICDGSAPTETVHMQLENVLPAGELTADVAKGPKQPLIKIIQNYHKYPFQTKPPKTQKENTNGQHRRGRGRKKREVKDDTDEEYVPWSCRTSKRNSKPRKPKPKSAVTKPPTEIAQDDEEDKHSIDSLHQQEGPPSVQDGKDLKFDNGSDDDDGTATTSTVCRNMPTLEEDLAMTSSDEEETGEVPSKELIARSKVCSSSQEETAEARKKATSAERMGSKQKVSDAKVKKAGLAPKRGRPLGSKNVVKVQESQKESISQQSLASSKKDKMTKKSAPKRKRKHSTSCSSSERETVSPTNCSSAETELELQLSTSSFGSANQQAADENELEKTQAAADRMDNLQILISPLTEDKIRKINTPQKKPKALAKASQTEISGLTWSIDLGQIDFRSEYFEKLRILLNNGAERNGQRGTNKSAKRPSTARESQPAGGSSRSFNGVDIPSRSILQRCLGSSSQPMHPPTPPVANGQRSSADELLFQRAISEVELGANNTADHSARQRLEREVNTVRSNFRIPKVKKQASTSPQVVTSSTPHLAEPTCREDDIDIEPLSLTSRAAVDQPQQHGGLRPAPGASAGVVQVTINNDYANDRGEFVENGIAARNRQEARPNIMMQDRFEPPVNRNAENALNVNYMPPPNVENGPLGLGQPNAGQDPLQAATSTMPLEGRSGLPNRAEMQNVRRTIRNEMPMPQQQPQLALPGIPVSIAQPYVPEVMYNPPQQNAFSMFGGSQPAPFAASSNTFNRGGPSLGYGAMDIPVFNGEMMGMHQQQQPSGNPNNINEFLAMLSLWEQFRHQQQPQRPAPFIQPPVQPPVAPLPAMAIPAGSNAGSSFGQLFTQIGQVAAQPSTSQLEPQRASEQMESICYIFGCIDSLNGRCIKTHCRYPHVLPRVEEVYQKLASQSRDAIMMSYRFVAGRDDLFIAYFPVYAAVMGRNNMRHQLVNTITDCEQSKRPIQYYKHIVEGLKASGTSPVQAVQIILDKHTKKSFHQINVLIELILDTGDGMPTFLRVLEEFSHVKDFHYAIVSVNRLLEYCTLSPLPVNELTMFISKLMLKVPAGEEQLVNTRVLLEFIQKVRLEPALALDVEDIVKKYGSVTMRP